jgi:hypothetical protein
MKKMNAANSRIVVETGMILAGLSWDTQKRCASLAPDSILDATSCRKRTRLCGDDDSTDTI